MTRLPGLIRVGCLVVLGACAASAQPSARPLILPAGAPADSPGDGRTALRAKVVRLRVAVESLGIDREISRANLADYKKSFEWENPQLVAAEETFARAATVHEETRLQLEEAEAAYRAASREPAGAAVVTPSSGESDRVDSAAKLRVRLARLRAEADLLDLEFMKDRYVTWLDSLDYAASPEDEPARFDRALAADDPKAVAALKAAGDGAAARARAASAFCAAEREVVARCRAAYLAREIRRQELRLERDEAQARYEAQSMPTWGTPPTVTMPAPSRPYFSEPFAPAPGTPALPPAVADDITPPPGPPERPSSGPPQSSPGPTASPGRPTSR